MSISIIVTPKSNPKNIEMFSNKHMPDHYQSRLIGKNSFVVTQNNKFKFTWKRTISYGLYKPMLFINKGLI